ncbi:Ribosomal protein L7Ae/L30e/S12e/Gadd45 family protein [Neomoorella glycerini]|uniref:Ribosomal protein L7Ae/L30e/S12e/Gadd45 family protein n=1 Tax=Neomoorella glycerini TaxID=55779 RepID=A0A6I5ZUF8_9FIRM|nr:L7Ae/L30e/S12e/Gadd45 family ribosomal protein [Moorella glycerini]QGP93265.1 Ribosomal protein L7Ae/L30e/S12e/Gadd45 family protein [Moorella glycerini]
MNDVYNLLGLAYRAGKVAWGYQAVMTALKRRKVYLLLLAGDSSPRLRGKLLATCREYGSQGIIFGDKVTIGAALGKPPCAVVGVTDANLARLIRQQVREVGA